MIIEVELDPKDTAIEEATVSTWYVEEGEAVDEGDALVEMVSDNDTFDVRAPSSGTIVELRAAEDETLKAGDVLCLIDTEEAMDFSADEDEADGSADDEDEGGGIAAQPNEAA